MADTSPIASTDAASLRPLGAGGQRVAEAYPQIAAHLRRARGPDHAALFAEPVFDRTRGMIDWYAPGEGEAVPLDRLDPASRADVEARLATLLTDIEAEAAALKASPREGDRLLGDALTAAVRVPDRSWIRVRGGKPLLVGWAHEIGGRSVGPELLTRPTEARPVPMTVLMPRLPVPATWPRRLLWWLAALLALLLLLLLLLLWWDPWRWFALAPAGCVADRSGIALLDERRREEDRTGTLQAELARLQREAGRARLACPPIRRQAEPQPQPQPQPQPPRNEDLDRPGRPNGGGGGIRTHDTLFTYTGFRDRRLQPLGHPSGPSCRSSHRPRPISTAPLRRRAARLRFGRRALDRPPRPADPVAPGSPARSRPVDRRPAGRNGVSARLPAPRAASASLVKRRADRGKTA